MIYCECRDTNSPTFIVGANFKTLKQAKAYVKVGKKLFRPYMRSITGCMR